MNIARLSNLKPVLVSLALTFSLIAQVHGHTWDPPFQQQYDEHEFLAACRQGRLDIVEYWLRTTDFDPNTLYESGCSGHKVRGLPIAIGKGYTDIARLLLENGANPDITTDSFIPPIYLAIKYGQTNIVNILLEHGANPNLRSSSGSSPLSYACFKGEVLAAKALLDKGADANWVGSGGITPLYYAIQHGHHCLVKELLDYGADSSLGGYNFWCFRETPLRLAKREKPLYQSWDPIKYKTYTRIIELLNNQKRPVPTPAQQHSKPESTYGTPAQSVVDEDISSEGVVALGAALQQVTFQKDAPK